MYRVVEIGKVALPLWLGAGAFIGAGIFAPFRRFGLGAVIGPILQLIIFLVWLHTVEL